MRTIRSKLLNKSLILNTLVKAEDGGSTIKLSTQDFNIDQPEWQLWEDFKNAKDLISDFYYANPQKPGLSRDFIFNPLWEPLQS